MVSKYTSIDHEMLVPDTGLRRNVNSTRGLIGLAATLICLTSSKKFFFDIKHKVWYYEEPNQIRQLKVKLAASCACVESRILSETKTHTHEKRLGELKGVTTPISPNQKDDFE